MAALARLFVRPHAKLAILDEALNLMDQLKLRQIVMPKLFEFTRRHGICLIVITHNLSLLRELDHIFVMDRVPFCFPISLPASLYIPAIMDVMLIT